MPLTCSRCASPLPDGCALQTVTVGGVALQTYHCRVCQCSVTAAESIPQRIDALERRADELQQAATSLRRLADALRAQRERSAL